MTGPDVVDVAVAVVGGGPAGLTAAAALAGRLAVGGTVGTVVGTGAGVGAVVVLERDSRGGGIPRHSAHPGFGGRDLHRFLSGPVYARTLVDRAVDAGATLRTSATVTGWAGERALEVTSPAGRQVVRAGAVVLATGARERPRPARLVPGDRPEGVYTTGLLQQLVHLHRRSVGSRAVVVGAEAVSWSAVLTLRHAGCDPVLVTTRYPRPEASAAFTVAGRLGLGVPVATSTRVVGVRGRHRVEAVEVEHVPTGRRRTVACDAVVFTGDWVPESELARLAGLDDDPGLRGPLVDTMLRTSVPGVFAAGNLCHPVDTADVAALDGQHVAASVVDWLDRSAGAEPFPEKGVRLVADAPFTWVAPGVLRPGDVGPPRGRYLLGVQDVVRRPRVVVRQDGRVVGTLPVPWGAAPGRLLRLPALALRGVHGDGGEVRIGLG